MPDKEKVKRLVHALEELISEFGTNEHRDCGCLSCARIRQAKATLKAVS